MNTEQREISTLNILNSNMPPRPLRFIVTPLRVIHVINIPVISESIEMEGHTTPNSYSVCQQTEHLYGFSGG